MIKEIPANNKKIKPAIKAAPSKLKMSEYQPINGAMIAKKIRITKLRTDNTVARTLESVNWLI